MPHIRQLLLCGAALSLLAACGGPAQKAPAPGVKVGKPYTISGQSYTPEYDPQYDRTGTASWYGPGFHGKKTANGETFDQHAMTAAHPTLPMPSLVRVTNLENGKSVVVRINDRGPFKDQRIIDLSRASAKELGVDGLARVRVQYLARETEEYWAQMNLETDDVKFASNDPYAPAKGGKKLARAAIREEAEEVKVAAASEPGLPDEFEEQEEPARAPIDTSPVSSAPVASVASSDLPPATQPSSPRPAPRLSLVSEAQAEEAPARGKPVQLYSPSGGAIGSRAGRSAPAYSAPEPEALSPAAKASDGGWFVQAGSFSSEANAEKFARRLRNLGAVSIKPVEVNGKTWQRVRAGPFATRSEAEAALPGITQAGAAGAKIIRE